MSNLLKRRERLCRIILLVAAIGCSSATLSGTLAAMSPGARAEAPAHAAAERFA